MRIDDGNRKCRTMLLPWSCAILSAVLAIVLFVVAMQFKDWIIYRGRYLHAWLPATMTSTPHVVSEFDSPNGKMTAQLLHGDYADLDVREAEIAITQKRALAADDEGQRIGTLVYMCPEVDNPTVSWVDDRTLVIYSRDPDGIDAKLFEPVWKGIKIIAIENLHPHFSAAPRLRGKIASAFSSLRYMVSWGLTSIALKHHSLQPSRAVDSNFK